MELTRITLPPITAPGAVTTFYSFESGTARSVALSNIAVLLAGRQNATVPVLMIDWDTESPGLHHYFERHGEHGGVLEYFQACADHLQSLGRGPASQDDEALARQVLEAVDWQLYVERVDESRPLYLMRAGRFDASYGERADRMDWDGLFKACPALFRCFAAYMASQFGHVLVDARSGRSAAVSICTTLLADRIVALFSPNRRSIEGMAGVLTRAIDYRCSHEDEQRPLLLYPLPCSIDSADSERRMRWRRGIPSKGLPGYQPALEKLLRECYGISRPCLDSYFDEVQLQQTHAIASGEQLAACLDGGDRFSLTRTFEALLEWLGEGRFPWQSRAEVALLRSIDAARAPGGPDEGAGAARQAHHLNLLGELYVRQGRERQAQDCFDQSAKLRTRALGEHHPDTRESGANLAALLRQRGKLHDAKYLYESLLEEKVHPLAACGGPDLLSLRSGLASTLALLGEFDAALALHDEVTQAYERQFGAGHQNTLASLASQAETLTRQGDLSRARMVYERVLRGRQCVLGNEHNDTLACAQQLAILLCDLGDLRNARKLQEMVVGARERHAGPDHAETLRARETLAEIWAAQGDLNAVRSMQEALAKARECRLGPDHPETLSTQLRLAATLGKQGELEAARRLQEHVVNLHERIHGIDDLETLHSKKLLATTLSMQGESVAARKLEESVLQGSDRLIHTRGITSGPHQSHKVALGLKASILAERDKVGPPDTLDNMLAQLQKLIDSASVREARALADTLRKPVLGRGVANPLRKRGVAMIRQVYSQEGDKDALLSFAQDEVSALEGALAGALVEARVAPQ